MLKKIATHDSATGERSKNFLHALGKPFAQTQNKTIKEQYEVGVRYFDLRIDKDLVLLAYEKEEGNGINEVLSKLDHSVVKNIAIIIGAEGGFSEREVEKIAPFEPGHCTYNIPYAQFVIPLQISVIAPEWPMRFEIEGIMSSGDWLVNNMLPLNMGDLGVGIRLKRYSPPFLEKKYRLSFLRYFAW